MNVLPKEAEDCALAQRTASGFNPLRNFLFLLYDVFFNASIHTLLRLVCQELRTHQAGSEEHSAESLSDLRKLRSTRTTIQRLNLSHAYDSSLSETQKQAALGIRMRPIMKRQATNNSPAVLKHWLASTQSKITL